MFGRPTREEEIKTRLKTIREKLLPEFEQSVPTRQATKDKAAGFLQRFEALRAEAIKEYGTPYARGHGYNSRKKPATLNNMYEKIQDVCRNASWQLETGKSLTEEVAKLEKELDQIAAEKQLKNNSVSLNNEAVVYLIEKGKKPGVDFDAAKAVGAANHLAFELKVEEMKGQDIGSAGCDECSSYEVGERRCSCGNRRQSLSYFGDFKTGINIYAEAY